MNTPSSAIQKSLLPKGMALVIDDAKVVNPDQATGYFLVNETDARIKDHRSSMSAGLLAEFAHQTGDFLLQNDKDWLPCVKSSHIVIFAAALPGDSLVCTATINMRNGRKTSFTAVIMKTNCGKQELIAKVTFTRTSFSKRIRQRMEQKTHEALQP